MATSSMKNDRPKNVSGKFEGSSDLVNHPEYRKMVEYYQTGKFKKCLKRIKALEEQYPAHPDLQRFKENIELKFSLKSMTRSIYRKETHEKIKGLLKFSYLIILTVIFVLLVSIFSYEYINNNFFAGLTRQERIQLEVLDAQADQLLSEGEPEAAAERLEQIREIDPDHESIPDLASRVYDLLLLKRDYQKAMGLLAEERETEALNILMKIEQENPGLWDVGQQIDLIQSSPTP